MRKLSFGEIAAAWVCCGTLALGALLLNSGGGRGDPAAAVYAGAHIPGRGAAALREGDASRGRDDGPAAEFGVAAETPGAIVIGSAEDLPKPVAAAGRKSAARHCRYAVRQTLLRYSAAVARLADAGAASGVREASQ